jgi:hypothetical protein
MSGTGSYVITLWTRTIYQVSSIKETTIECGEGRGEGKQMSVKSSLQHLLQLIQSNKEHRILNRGTFM